MPDNSKSRLAQSLSKTEPKPDLKNYKKAPKDYPLSPQGESPQDSENAVTLEGTNAVTLDSENALTHDSEITLTHKGDSAVMPESENALTHESTNAKVPLVEPERKSQGFKLRTSLIKSLKRIALEEDRHLYDIMEEALSEYIERHRRRDK